MSKTFLTATIDDAMTLFRRRYTSTPLTEGQVETLLLKGVTESPSFREQREKMGHKWLLGEILGAFKRVKAKRISRKRDATPPTADDSFLFVFIDAQDGSQTKLGFCLLQKRLIGE